MQGDSSAGVGDEHCSQRGQERGPGTGEGVACWRKGREAQELIGRWRIRIE